MIKAQAETLSKKLQLLLPDAICIEIVRKRGDQEDYLVKLVPQPFHAVLLDSPSHARRWLEYHNLPIEPQPAEEETQRSVKGKRNGTGQPAAG